MTPRPIGALEGVEAYSPPRHEAPVDLRLDGNEGSRPGPELMDVIVKAGPGILRTYPDGSAVERELAEMMGVDAARVLVTAGGDDALERIIRSVLCEGREMVLPVPTFEMFERYARLTGGVVKGVPWLEERFPVEDVLGACTERTALVVLVTPNSPTGRAVGAKDLVKVCEAMPGALVLVDLAYTEFADVDLTPVALDIENAAIVRSMSKAWGLAGLRVGWCAGPARVVQWARAAGHPYAVSAPSLAMALARLRHGKDEVKAFVARVREERDELVAVVRRLGGEAERSQANFVLARFADAPWVRDALAGMGIGVRLFPGRPYLDGYVRITLPGDGRDFGRLVAALETTLAPGELVVGAGTLAKGRGPGAWVACGSVDDVKAARAAGALALGVAGKDGKEELLRAGAARVFERVDEIEEMMP